MPRSFSSDTREGGLPGDNPRRSKWKIAILRIAAENACEGKAPRCPREMLFAGQSWVQSWVWGAMP
jgi:hypothetical protein